MAGYVLGNLSPEETQAFEDLLAERPQLHREVDRLRETLELMPYALPEVAPPPQLRGAILDRTRPDDRLPTVTSRNHLWFVGFSAIAAIVLALLGVDNYRLRRQLARESPQWPQAEPIVAETLDESGWDGVTRLVNDHLKSLDRRGGPVDFVSANATEISERFAPQFSFARSAPIIEKSEIRLLGGSFCRLGKIKGIRYTYRLDNDRLISFYQLEASERGAFPLSDSERLYVRSERGPSTIVWSQDDILYALVSELPSDRLQEVATYIQ